MKRLAFLAICLTTLMIRCLAQNPEKSAPPGFDSLREGVSNGTIDTVTYESKAVGTKRRALIYTPPGYSKKIKYPVLYLLHGIGGDEKEWLNGGKPQAILDNLYAANKLAPMIVVMPNGRAMKDDRAIGNIFDSLTSRGMRTPASGVLRICFGVETSTRADLCSSRGRVQCCSPYR